MNKIKQIFTDIFIVYKNFIAWNISKFKIFFVSLFIIFVVFIIFLILAYILNIYSPINFTLIYEKLINSNLGLDKGIFEIFLEHKIFSFLFFLLIILFISTILISYNFANFLLVKLHLNYIRDKNFLVNKNIFGDFFLNFGKYFSITINFVLYLILPLLLFLIGYFIILLIFPDSERASEVFSNFIISDKFSFWVVSLSIVSFFYFIFLIYRIIFSYVILADNEHYINKLKYSFYIKESLRLTKSFKKFFIFLVLFFILLFLASPILKIGENLKNSLIKNIELVDYKEKIFPFLDSREIKNKEEIYKNFGQIRENLNKNLILYIIYLFVYFLIIAGLFNLFIVSFYERFLLIDRIDVLDEKYKSGNFLVKKKIKIKKFKKK